MNRLFFALALTSAVCAFSFNADAHAHLSTSSPKDGATLGSSPKQIELTFTEGVEPAFSSVELKTAAGGPVAYDPPKISGKTMVIPLKAPLAAGSYRVTWRATAVDTHKTQGSFTFVVTP